MVWEIKILLYKHPLPPSISLGTHFIISQAHQWVKFQGLYGLWEILDLIDTWTKAFTILFYVLSHRPLDLDNIYNQDQVKLLMKEGEHLTIPDFDDIYVDSEVTFFFLSLGPK